MIKSLEDERSLDSDPFSLRPYLSIAGPIAILIQYPPERNTHRSSIQLLIASAKPPIREKTHLSFDLWSSHRKSSLDHHHPCLLPNKPSWASSTPPASESTTGTSTSCMVLYGYDASVFNALQNSDNWVEYFNDPGDQVIGAINTAYVVGAIVAGFVSRVPLSPTTDIVGWGDMVVTDACSRVCLVLRWPGCGLLRSTGRDDVGRCIRHRGDVHADVCSAWESGLRKSTTPFRCRCRIMAAADRQPLVHRRSCPHRYRSGPGIDGWVYLYWGTGTAVDPRHDHVFLADVLLGRLLYRSVDRKCLCSTNGNGTRMCLAYY